MTDHPYYETLDLLRSAVATIADLQTQVTYLAGIVEALATHLRHNNSDLSPLVQLVLADWDRTKQRMGGKAAGT